MKTRMFLSCALLFFAAGCKGRGSTSSAKGDVEPLPCPTDPFVFSLGTLSKAPPVSSLGLGKPIYSQGNLKYVDPNSESNIKLEVCVNELDGTTSITRITTKSIGFYPGFKKFVPNESSKVEGLADAALGDIKNLYIQTPVIDTAILVIKALPSESGASGVYAYIGEEKDGVIVPQHEEVVKGTLEQADPFSTAICKAGEEYKKSQFKIQDAQFDLEYCYYKSTTGTATYDVVKMSVTDNHPSVPAEKKSVVFDGSDKVKEVAKYKIRHHNECDSMYINLGNREFAFTAPTFLETCQESELVPNAPMYVRPSEGKPHFMYKMRRGSGAWETGHADCGHYVIECAP
ncbi:MAG: hypothetical protein AB7T49_03995 [Oligoflexales bacterium]